MDSKSLYLAIIDLLDNYAGVDIGVKVGALQIAAARLSVEAIRAERIDKPPKPDRPAEAESGAPTQAQIKEAAKRIGARVSFKDDGGVGVLWEKGGEWENFKKSNLKALFHRLFHAPTS